MKKLFSKEKLLRLLSYILVASLASGVTWMLAPEFTKLDDLASVIERRFIGEADQKAIQDAAAHAMVAELGDRWSYYIPAEDYDAHVNTQNNEYVGIGITVLKRADGTGYDIGEVFSDGPAAEAGLLAGDIITHADGQPVGELNTAALQGIIMGKKDTQVEITVLRGEETLHFTVTRRAIHTKAATGQMLTDTVGYVLIDNFHWGSSEESIAVIEDLLEQGATSFVFDVRGNPGGFKKELVLLLDYLLPEGPLFRSIDTEGNETVDESDAECLELPMAVLMNGSSYSAAEFFAAALSEYGWAVTVGEQTVGKGYFQNTIRLVDGSAVNLSVGKYATPNGINLTEVGGLTPDIPVEPGKIVADPLEDPQILAAIEALTGETK